jgi:hypothetical protein
MVERSISEAEVVAALATYHTSYTDPDGNRNLIAEVGDRRIRVVVKGGGLDRPILIITVIA